MFMRVAALAACAAAFGAIGPAQAQEVKLKVAAFLPKAVIITKPFYAWADHVNAQCKGTLQVSVIGPAAIKSLEQWNAVKTGVVDMHYGPANYYKGTIPEGDVFILARNEPSAQRKNGAWEMINDVHERKMNSHYLTNTSGGIQFYLYTTKAGKDGRFEDFRLRSVPIYDGFFKSLGANPVRMAPAELFTALERGAVDGYGWPLWGLDGLGLDKHTKFRHGPGFFSAASPILVNLDKWKTLGQAQRKCLDDTSMWLEAEWPKMREAVDAQQLAVQDKAGIKYVDMGADFARRAEDLYWDELAKGDPGFIKKIRPLLAEGS